MVTIHEHLFGSLQAYTITNKKNGEQVTFVPRYGANIIDLQLQKNRKTYALIDGFADETSLMQNEKSKSIHLLPFPNRIADGNYIFEGKQYQLPINKPKENNTIHGFIWNKPFQIKLSTHDESSVILHYTYLGEEVGYPFPFEVTMHYSLKSQQFKITLQIQNTGNSNMPLGYGWHPYFTLQSPVDHLQLQLPESNILETNHRLIPTGNKEKYTIFKTLQSIGNTQFDTAFEITESAETFLTLLWNEQQQYGIRLQQSNTLPYLQVYIPPHRNSIALEPMSCSANAFNSLPNKNLLKPKEVFFAEMSVSVF